MSRLQTIPVCPSFFGGETETSAEAEWRWLLPRLQDQDRTLAAEVELAVSGRVIEAYEYGVALGTGELPLDGLDHMSRDVAIEVVRQQLAKLTGLVDRICDGEMS